jgi:hypothetical protein
MNWKRILPVETSIVIVTFGTGIFGGLDSCGV